MADDDTREFIMLHHDECGELLHAQTMKAAKSHWDDGMVISFPKLELRNGDTITLQPKPTRAPLPEFDEVEEPAEAAN